MFHKKVHRHTFNTKTTFVNAYHLSQIKESISQHIFKKNFSAANQIALQLGSRVYVTKHSFAVYYIKLLSS